MRADILAELMSRINVTAGRRIVVCDTSAGIVTAALAHRLGGRPMLAAGRGGGEWGDRATRQAISAAGCCFDSPHLIFWFLHSVAAAVRLFEQVLAPLSMPTLPATHPTPPSICYVRPTRCVASYRFRSTSCNKSPLLPLVQTPYQPLLLRSHLRQQPAPQAQAAQCLCLRAPPRSKPYLPLLLPLLLPLHPAPHRPYNLLSSRPPSPLRRRQPVGRLPRRPHPRYRRSRSVLPRPQLASLLNDGGGVPRCLLTAVLQSEGTAGRARLEERSGRRRGGSEAEEGKSSQNQESGRWTEELSQHGGEG